jgi:Tfp pilus assembly protein PilX
MICPNSSGISRQAGVALVVTLVILVLLAGLAVGLLQTSGLERGTSKAVADKAKADLAAQTAVNAAIAQLVSTLTTYPDAATTWETINGNDGTVLYYRDETPEQAIAATTAAQLYVLPLASGATAQTVANKSNALPTLTDFPASTANAYNFNHTRSSGDTQGWIGSSPQWLSTSPAPTTPQPLRGQWINLTDSNTKITGRYAYWMEDESFKANANLMGNTARGSGTLGNSPSQIPFQGILKSVLSGSPDYDAIATSITSYRGQFPSGFFFNYRDLNQVSGQPTLADTAKFEATIFSGASNQSRSGSKRINLNSVVSTSAAASAIRTQLDEIINAITYHLPNFAQRFYRNGSDKNSLDVTSTGSPSNQTIYLNKIAANFRDYIDTDSQPTIVNNDSGLTVNVGAVPTHSLPGGGAYGANEVVAIGKDAGPSLQEYMVRVKQIEPKTRPVATANYNIEIDHYIEFWNMTDKDISLSDLGLDADPSKDRHPFLRIANQFGWTSYGGTDIPVDPSRDFSIPLSSFKNSTGANLVFTAGSATVLTTDPVDLPSTFTGVDPTRVFRPPAGTPADSYRVYKGTCNRKTSSGHPHLDAQTRPTASSTASDMETEIIVGNDNGVLESFGTPAVYYITVNADDGTTSTNTERIDTTKWYFRASSLKGNASSSTPSQTGDPRTNNEQLSLTSSVANEDQTAYKLEVYDATPPFDNASFTALNSKFVNPALWTDPATNAPNSAHAPTIVANAALTSIGQLGDIFDPVRSKGVSADITLSRGGGRTFKIGQPDDLWDGDSGSASREWTAWRLADVFTTTDSVQLDGRININGVNRDNGAAFKAALYGYKFQASPDSDPTIASQALTDTQVSALVSQMQDRLKNQNQFTATSGPFAERGEFSEMPVFNSGTQLTGQNMTSIYDRGREELSRRLAELITTRGNIFTVYAVGQSLIPQSSGNPVVVSTSQLKVTFRLDPIWNAGTPTDPFDPTSTARFKKPDRYVAKILYAGD